MGKENRRLELSLQEARKISSYFQGLTESPRFGAGKTGALRALEHLGYVQIDTIHVVERAHHHVLWSRVPGYLPEQLGALVREGKAFEYWSHAASFLPMRDFRFSLPRKKRFVDGKTHWFRPTAEHSRWRKIILKRIREEGALTSSDFAEKGRKAAGWFERSPAKQMLEQIFMEGALMIAGREGFQKRYDLTERVLPPGTDTRFPNPEEEARHLIFSHLRSQGFARADEISYLRAPLRNAVRAALQEMQGSGELMEVRVEGMDRPYLAAAGFSAGAEAAVRAPGRVVILSPFDNFLIQRRRTRELYGFDYLLECYLPEAKRRYGYFCLPVLGGPGFLGRIDAKAHRAEGRLEVRSSHPHGKISRRDFLKQLRPELAAFARFNGCEGEKAPVS